MSASVERMRGNLAHGKICLTAVGVTFMKSGVAIAGRLAT